MDAGVAITIDATQALVWFERVWWVALRVGAMFMAAPLFGTAMVPMRVRLIVVLALSTALAALLPAPPELALDAHTVLAMTREVALGLAIGFLFRLAFEAIAFAGELVSQGMGLSFAQMLDPLRGVQSPVMSQLFTLVGALTFFAFDGHLLLIRVVFQSYTALPAGGTSAAASLLQTIPAFGGTMLAAGLSLALPIVIAMLVVNITFGVLARTAPALNPISIGLPAALFVGFVLLIALVPRMAAPLLAWINTTAATAAAVH